MFSIFCNHPCFTLFLLTIILTYTLVVWNGVRMRSPALEALGRSLRGETGLATSALTSLPEKVIACAVYPPEEDHSLWALEIFNASPVSCAIWVINVLQKYLAQGVLTSLSEEKVIACTVYLPEEDHSVQS